MSLTVPSKHLRGKRNNRCNKTEFGEEFSGDGENSETQTLNQRDAAEAESQEASAQQVPQSGQVRDGEVVGVQTPSPHYSDDEVSNIKEDGDLEERALTESTNFL